MAKQINTRLMLKHDSLKNWNESSLILKPGEVGVAYVDVATKDTKGNIIHVPTALLKVGENVENSTKTFKDLPFVSAVAADVYAWAKKDGIAVETVGEGECIANVEWKVTETNPEGALVITRIDVVTPAELEETLANYYTKEEIDELIDGVKDIVNGLDDSVTTVAEGTGIKVTDSVTEGNDHAYTVEANIDVVYKDSKIYLVDKTTNATIGTGFDASAFVKDSYLEKAEYDDVRNILTLTFIDNADELEAIEIDLNDLVDVYTADDATLESQSTPGGVIFKVKDGGISDVQLAGRSVTTDKINNGAVTLDKLDSEVQKTITDASTDAAAAVSTANSANETAGEAKQIAEQALEAASNATTGAAASAEAAAASAAEALASQNAAAQSASDASSAASNAAAAATDAGVHAGNANTAKEAAEGFAQAANNSAQAALLNSENANAAYQAALAAQEAAEGAKADAEAAKTAAVAAQVAAESAAGFADNVKDEATTAASKASASASAAAGSAQTASEKAAAASQSAADAANAKQSAEAAASNANADANRAETAQAAAEAAQAKAEEAQAAAENANSSATAIANDAKAEAEAATAASNAATQAVAGLHAIATSGSIYDVAEGANVSTGTDAVEYLIFDCGTASTII